VSVSVTVIVRVRDEADALNQCLELIRAQHKLGADLELVVVDNESADASAAVARRHGAQVVRISRARFSFGRALNLGASVAHGNVLVALSAHAFVRDPDWLSKLTTWFDDPSVACVCGERSWPDASRLYAPVRYGVRLAQGYPRWGYSNAAGAFRADYWRERGFREDLTGCEDKEWGRFWAVERNRVTVLDPGLAVEHDHTHDPVPDIFMRARREAEGFAMFLPPDQRSSLLSEWYWQTGFYNSVWKARFSHRRAARLLGDRLGAAAGVIRVASDQRELVSAGARR